MKFSTTPKRILGLFLVFSLFISTSVLAGNPLITRSFSGVWDQPEQESQGLLIQIAESNGEKVGIAYWFTFGEDLQTTWYVGVGPVSGNVINLDLYTVNDVGFMADKIEDSPGAVPVGTLDLTFKNCNHGEADFNTFDSDVIESVDFPIKRISSIYKQRCSGGISDDTPSGGKPLQMDVRLYPAVEGDSGKGKAKFWERTDRSDFKVEVEDIADGSYTLEICGGTGDVVQFDMPVTGGEGWLEFRSPEIADKLNLNFDPRDCRIELLEGDIVVLTSGDEVLSEKQTGKKDHGDKGKGIRIEADLTNTGVIAGAEGEAEYRIHGDKSEFSVKIKKVPVGFYAVDVDGVNVGDIEVADDQEFDGKIKFTDPQKSGTLELNFDPRGNLIEVRQNDDDDTNVDPVILEALFPDE